jgi:hypothetical protein
LVIGFIGHSYGATKETCNALAISLALQFTKGGIALLSSSSLDVVWKRLPTIQIREFPFKNYSKRVKWTEHMRRKEERRVEKCIRLTSTRAIRENLQENYRKEKSAGRSRAEPQTR